MTENNPLVSIIVRTKDRPKLLRRALQSIAAQTYKPIEVVLVNDGGCALDTGELKTILGDISLNYIRLEKNTGRAHAGNVGIENARGEYIGFLDDDDEFYPEHAETLVSALTKNSYQIAYTDSLMASKKFNPQTLEFSEIKKELIFSLDFDYGHLIFENFIPFMCLLFKREALVDSGGFDPKFDLYEDWDLLIRLGEKYPFFHIKKTTADYNQWDSELQIAQKNRNHDFIRKSYLKVLSKHSDKFTLIRIHSYVSHHVNTRNSLKELTNEAGKEVQEYRNQLREMGSNISMLKDENSNLKGAMKERDKYIAYLEDAINQKEADIQFIYSSDGWKLLTMWYRVRDKLLPQETRRRLFTKLFFKTIVDTKEILRNFNKTNLKKFIYHLKNSNLSAVEKKIEQKLHIEATGLKETIFTASAQNPTTKMQSKEYFNFLFEMNTKRGEDYVPLAYPRVPETDIKLIAFYLPQYHPIQENDRWWGRGFTEWANVTRAVPQFIGHYQPRLPGELGFYDLRIPEVQERQIELARQYGIYGFCFHFYWFDGRTLLETPIKQFAENFDFPFCINWANENWTRRWDGQDNEILIAQNHTHEDDIKFIEYISQYLTNKNYIRIKSKPLLVIYRPDLFPNPKATAEKWREWCIKNGIGEIYLAATHSFEHIDPRSIGFDAAIEFAPNTFPAKDLARKFNIVNPNFKGLITDYKNAIDYSRNYIPPLYKKFRGICPEWDNEARRPGRGTVFANSTPSNFNQWLKILCRFTYNNFEKDERIIFINAWNEWAEGAYLEPDRRYGYAYLQSVADALIEHEAEKKQKKIIYVCHDAHLHGAQLLSLNIAKTLKLNFKYDVHFILKSGGELEPEYAKYATVYNLERDYRTLKEKGMLFVQLYNLGIREAICNTVVSGDVAKLLYDNGIRTISLVHEMPGIINQLGIEDNVRLLAEYSYKIIFPSDFVRAKLKTITKIDDKKTEILPQGLYKFNRYKERKPEASRNLRKTLGLSRDAKIVLGVGFGDYRKGIDLFIEAARIVKKVSSDVYFLWVGNIHSGIMKKIDHEVKTNKNILLHNSVKDTSLFYAGADIYLLTSREDPFPTVVLEAMDAGLPVIGFCGAGGFGDIVNENTGTLVPYLDVTAMAREVINLLNDKQRRKLLESNASKLIEDKFNFTDYVYKLLALLGHEYKKVSVIIPNYNYARYLELRLHSVLKQSYPIFEIIFLDDASTDDSLKVAETYFKEELNIKLIKNETNSGSVYKQWIKGLQMAKGDYIWIAEADDLCENNFLEELVSCFEKDRDVVLAYCQSMQINENGKILADNYFEYTNDIDNGKWRKDYIRDGLREIKEILVVKNTIPNVSATLFRKTDVSPIADKIINYKVAGDWFFYIWLLEQGKISYVSKSLNLHRRHNRSVVKSEDKELHFNEVVGMQEYIMGNFDVTEEAIGKVLSYREYLKNTLG
jgi:glycosyltransferase involved in cell wall biosynthesis